jgi:hypothetical protein
VVITPGTTTAVGGSGTASAPLAEEDVEVGSELRPDTGTFARASQLAFQYQRCATADEGSCSDIAGATSASYRPSAADAGYRLRLVVVARNAGGSVRVATPMTRPVSLPAESAAPAPAAVAPMCVSRRAVTLHWKVPAHQRVIAYSVRLNGTLYANLGSRRHGVNVRMNGRPKELVVVTVAARTATGRRLGTTRRYRTCAGRLTGTRPGTLRLVARR